MDEEFVDWLIGDRGLAAKPARDILSRCRKIESELGVQLTKVAASQAACDTMLLKVMDKFSYRNDMLYAFRLFINYKNPKVKFNLYARIRHTKPSGARIVK